MHYRGGGGGFRLGTILPDNFARGKFRQPLKSPKLKVPYAQIAAIKHTIHAQETPKVQHIAITWSQNSRQNPIRNAT